MRRALVAVLAMTALVFASAALGALLRHSIR